MTEEELIQKIKDKTNPNIPHSKIEVSEELLSCISEAFEAFFDMGDAHEWKEMTNQDFFYVCKVYDWLSSVRCKKYHLEGRDQQYLAAIQEICDNEDYEPPEDEEWLKAEPDGDMY